MVEKKRRKSKAADDEGYIAMAEEASREGRRGKERRRFASAWRLVCDRKGGRLAATRKTAFWICARCNGTGTGAGGEERLKKRESKRRRCWRGSWRARCKKKAAKEETRVEDGRETRGGGARWGQASAAMRRVLPALPSIAASPLLSSLLLSSPLLVGIPQLLTPPYVTRRERGAVRPSLVGRQRKRSLFAAIASSQPLIGPLGLEAQPTGGTKERERSKPNGGTCRCPMLYGHRRGMYVRIYKPALREYLHPSIPSAFIHSLRRLRPGLAGPTAGRCSSPPPWPDAHSPPPPQPLAEPMTSELKTRRQRQAQRPLIGSPPTCFGFGCPWLAPSLHLDPPIRPVTPVVQVVARLLIPTRQTLAALERAPWQSQPLPPSLPPPPPPRGGRLPPLPPAPCRNPPDRPDDCGPPLSPPYPLFVPSVLPSRTSSEAAPRGPGPSMHGSFARACLPACLPPSLLVLLSPPHLSSPRLPISPPHSPSASMLLLPPSRRQRSLGLGLALAYYTACAPPGSTKVAIRRIFSVLAGGIGQQSGSSPRESLIFEPPLLRASSASFLALPSLPVTAPSGLGNMTINRNCSTQVSRRLGCWIASAVRYLAAAEHGYLSLAPLADSTSHDSVELDKIPPDQPIVMLPNRPNTLSGDDGLHLSAAHLRHIHVGLAAAHGADSLRNPVLHLLCARHIDTRRVLPSVAEKKEDTSRPSILSTIRNSFTPLVTQATLLVLAFPRRHPPFKILPGLSGLEQQSKSNPCLTIYKLDWELERHGPKVADYLALFSVRSFDSHIVPFAWRFGIVATRVELELTTRFRLICRLGHRLSANIAFGSGQASTVQALNGNPDLTSRRGLLLDLGSRLLLDLSTGCAEIRVLGPAVATRGEHLAEPLSWLASLLPQNTRRMAPTSSGIRAPLDSEVCTLSPAGKLPPAFIAAPSCLSKMPPEWHVHGTDAYVEITTGGTHPISPRGWPQAVGDGPADIRITVVICVSLGVLESQHTRVCRGVLQRTCFISALQGAQSTDTWLRHQTADQGWPELITRVPGSESEPFPRRLNRRPVAAERGEVLYSPAEPHRAGTCQSELYAPGGRLTVVRPRGSRAKNNKSAKELWRWTLSLLDGGMILLARMYWMYCTRSSYARNSQVPRGSIKWLMAELGRNTVAQHMMREQERVPSSSVSTSGHWLSTGYLVLPQIHGVFSCPRPAADVTVPDPDGSGIEGRQGLGSHTQRRCGWLLDKKKYNEVMRMHPCWYDGWISTPPDEISPTWLKLARIVQVLPSKRTSRPSFQGVETAACLAGPLSFALDWALDDWVERRTVAIRQKLLDVGGSVGLELSHDVRFFDRTSSTKRILGASLRLSIVESEWKEAAAERQQQPQPPSDVRDEAGPTFVNASTVLGESARWALPEPAGPWTLMQDCLQWFTDFQPKEETAERHSGRLTRQCLGVRHDFAGRWRLEKQLETAFRGH
ncbi:hypothetical protein HRG_014936 [Hirsutella rhossiliensis]